MNQYNNPIPLISGIDANANLAEGYGLVTPIDTTNINARLQTMAETYVAEQKTKVAEYEKRLEAALLEGDDSALTDPEALAFVKGSRDKVLDFTANKSYVFADPTKYHEDYMKFIGLKRKFNQDLETAKQVVALDKAFKEKSADPKADKLVNTAKYSQWKSVPFGERAGTPIVPYVDFALTMSDGDKKTFAESVISKSGVNSTPLKNDKGQLEVSKYKLIDAENAYKALQSINGGDLLDRYQYVKDQFPTIEKYIESQFRSLGIASNYKTDKDGRGYYELVGEADNVANKQYGQDQLNARTKATLAAGIKQTQIEANAKVEVSKQEVKKAETEGQYDVLTEKEKNKGKKNSSNGSTSADGGMFTLDGLPPLRSSANGEPTLEYIQDAKGWSGTIPSYDYDKDYKAGIGGRINQMRKYGLIPKKEAGTMDIEFDVVYKDGEPIGIRYGKRLPRKSDKKKVVVGETVTFKQLQDQINLDGKKANLEDFDNTEKPELP